MVMKKKMIVLLAILAPALRMAAGCPGVPSLGSADACRKACGTNKFTHDLCMDTMRRAGMDPCPSHRETATVYAIMAARVAEAAYDDTILALNTQLQQNASLGDYERVAYEGCLSDLAAARDSVDRAAQRMMSSCDLGGLAGELLDGMLSLENCRDRMMLPWIDVPSLYPMVMDNRGKVLLAYLLAKLLGI